jgi:hypothetical protein
MDPSATRRRLLTVTGVAGIGYALSWIVSIALARAARRSGAAEAARVALIAGGAAALISLLQFALGAALAVTTTSATAHLRYDAVNRLDGVKMLALAGLGLAGAASGVLLLVFITGTGITLDMSTNKPSRNTPAARKADAEAGALS